MTNTNQLSMNLGGLSGTEKVEPVKHGDIIVKHSGNSYVVLSVDDNIQGLVFLCVDLKSGANCVVLEREVAYRRR